MAAIIAFFASGWGKVVEYGAAVSAVLGAILGVYESVKNSGKQEQVVADQKKALEDVQVANKIEQAVDVMPVGTAANELLKSYSRD